jgi:uncharacterized membrane protein YfcA
VPSGAETWVVFCLTFVLANLVQGVTGFGSVVLTISVLAFFFPVKQLVPLLVAISLVPMIWFALVGRRNIQWVHVRIILLLSLAGLPLGYLVYQYLPAGVLKIALGVFVVLVAVANLAGLRIRVKIPELSYYLLNLLGGIFHGALAAGGPLLIIYTARSVEDKAAFRATLSIVWVVLNSILCITYLATGGFSDTMLPALGVGVACMLLGTALGMLAHARMPEKPFRIVVFVLLLISGVALLLPLG